MALSPVIPVVEATGAVMQVLTRDGSVPCDSCSRGDGAFISGCPSFEGIPAVEATDAGAGHDAGAGPLWDTDTALFT